MNKPFASLVLMLLIGPLSFGQQPRLVLPIGHSQAQEPKLVIPVGHMSEITSVQFSSTGKWIATGSYDNTAKIWEMETGRLLNTLEGHTETVTSSKFSSDDKFIATESVDGTVKIWITATGKLLYTLEGDQELDCEFSRDSKYMIFGSGPDHKTISVLETVTATFIQTQESNIKRVNSALFSPDGKRIVITSDENGAKILETSSGKLSHSLEDNTNGIGSALFSPDGKWILTTATRKFHSEMSADELWEDLSDPTINLKKNADGKKPAPVKLWNSKTGKLFLSLKGHKSFVKSARFSPDGKWIIASAHDTTSTIWETATGKKFLEDIVNYAEVSPDGKWIITLSSDGTAKIWETATRKLFHTLKDRIRSIWEFSLDGKLIAASSWDGEAQIWNTTTGKLHNSIKGTTHFFHSAKFSPDGKFIVGHSSYSFGAKVWETSTGKLFHYLIGHTERVGSPQFSPDGNSILVPSGGNWGNKCAKIWDVSAGKKAFSLIERNYDFESADFSPDGKWICTSSADAFKIWESDKGKLVHSRKGDALGLSNLRFSPDGNRMVTTRNDTAKIWETATGELINTIGLGHGPIVEDNTSASTPQFSPNGKWIGTRSWYDKTAKIWETATGKLIYSLSDSCDHRFLQFSPDGKWIGASGGSCAKIWASATGNLIQSIGPYPERILSMLFSPDGKRIVTTSDDDSVKIRETVSGNLIHSIISDAYINIIQFSPDGNRIILAPYDGSLKLWDSNSGKVIKNVNCDRVCDIHWPSSKILTINNSKISIVNLENEKSVLSLVLVDSTDWVVTHPSGLFDASPSAMDKLYFVQGLDIIDFNQLKERYYEPGLWKKVMAGEPLRNVVGFKSIELPPDIQIGQVDEQGYLNINLTNRGGGIGEVNLFVNGKEVIKDARDANVKPDAPNASLKVFVGKHKSIVKGQENLIGVKAWNKDHWVQSRGIMVSYQSNEIENYKPAVHIITCGVSDYTGSEIDLKYAAKDANDMSTALQLGAKKLFGTERSFIYNLTTSQPKEFYPTKTNILKAFEKISSTAHPLDIFVMYVSGHGINYGGQDGDWHYLTQEAYTGSGAAYNDPAIRAQTTISSNELVELFKKVPALKQVLMLDACASGKVVDNLMAQKDIESSTLRALDRMRDRTGMHIITGCTADAVSYEASKYGQGVLTYSLLEGIRGAALREDQYVDVNKLFQYAQDRVPQLAEGIGGIQSPQVFSPQGSQSFDIGLLSDVEKKEIPIAKIRPVYVRSNFQDENEMEDVLGLGKLINTSLNEVSSKGVDSQIIFVDVVDYPEGCKLIGRYKKENGKIVLKLRRKCGTEDKTYDLKADDVEMLRAEILKIL